MGDRVQQAFRKLASAMIAVCMTAVLMTAVLATTPAAAQQATATPIAVQQGTPSPAIVQSLGDARDDNAKTITSVTGALLGAAGGALLVNVVTGGAALAPVIGIPASNIFGGAWLAAAGSLPLAGEMAVHTITAATVAFGGGLMGMYFVGD